VHKSPEFSELLKLIDERSSVFRAAIQSAPDLDAQVPTCPEWTLLDLARHLGGGQRRWAAVVTAGGALQPVRHRRAELRNFIQDLDELYWPVRSKISDRAANGLREDPDK
jgi:hypothetical protein